MFFPILSDELSGKRSSCAVSVVLGQVELSLAVLIQLCDSASNSTQKVPAPNHARPPHVTQHLSLSDFEAHFDSPDSQDPAYYTYPCRCSATFIITHEDLEDGIDVVGCSGCGEWARVAYEVSKDE